jgi:hypothetical protein
MSKKITKGKKGGIAKAWSVPEDIMGYEEPNKPAFKVRHAPSALQRKMSVLRVAVLRHLLRRVGVAHLDAAILEKTGKVHPKAAFSRGYAKGYNQGRQDERNYWKDKGYWLES